VKVAIVGCGAVATANYAPTLPAAGVRVAFVHDRDARAAEALADRMDARAVSLDVVVREADAVLIATPPSSHAGLVRALLRPGRLLLCEKPFVGTRAEAVALAAEARAARTTLRVGHLRRVFPAVRLARDLVRAGVLGTVRGLDAVEGGRFAWTAASGYTETDRYGGVLYDTGSHVLDLALYVSGLDDPGAMVACAPERVTRDRAEPAHAVRASGRLSTAAGDVSFALHLSRYEVLANRVVVTGDRGRLAVAVGPGGGLRLWSASGSVPLVSDALDYDGAFVAQWHEVFGGRGEELAADRFIAVTGMLEAIAAAGEVVPWPA
jgi:predicted dehydrogenase